MGTRGRAVVWGVGLTLVGAIGVLWALNGRGPDPDQIKAELAARIDELNKIPTTEAVRRDALAEELLNEEQYKQYAKAHWLKLERAHRAIHDAAQLERAAKKDVPPFLTRCADPSKMPATDLDRAADECRSLLNNYGATRFGEPLRVLSGRLNVAIEARVVGKATDVVELSAKVHRKVQEGHYAPAWRDIDEFDKRTLRAPEFLLPVSELRQFVLRKAEAAVQKIGAQIAASRSEDERKKPAALLLGEDFEGLPLPLLEVARRQSMPR